ncbi:MAG: CPBP family intramembrane glutamic endopeptidase [Candidatus Nanopelagicales bacterium]
MGHLPEPSSGHYLQWAGRGRSSVWRYLAGTMVVVLAWSVGTVLVQVLAAATGLDEDARPGPSLAYLTGTFALGALAVPLVVRCVHRRPAWSVGVAQWPGPVRDVGSGIGIALISLLLADALATVGHPLRYVGMDWGRWWSVAVIAVVGFAVQVGFEELMFRGYLTQAVRRLTSKPLLVVGAPSLLFAGIHWGNLDRYGRNPLQLIPYLLMGATLGWAAWRSGSLWLPFGIHWANNTYAVLLVGNPGDVLPFGAPFVRDLTDLGPAALAALTLLQAGVQLALVEWVVRRRTPADRPLRSACGPVR